MLWITGVLPASATRHVVLLFDERPDLPGLAALDAEFVRTITEKSTERIEIYREEMDRSRFGGDYQSLFRDFLRAKYAGRKIDAVVAAFGPALDFLLDLGSEIFPGASIIFCGIDQAELGNRTLPPHVRGVLLKREFSPTLELALGLHPQTRQVIVVGGTSDFDKLLLEQARKEFEPFANRVNVTYATALPLQQLLSDIKQTSAEQHHPVYRLLQRRRGRTLRSARRGSARLGGSKRAALRFSGSVPRPRHRRGQLYGSVTQGAGAAELVLRSLSDPAAQGAQVLQPPVNKLQFDWRQMQRWGISEARLPQGSQIHFRDAGAMGPVQLLIFAIVAAIARASRPDRLADL